jgi:alkanesulfonate monooxygenase SsuD/methylene tetrahydromethanopterin reductase-like flavin-dependent oxidoreductase (luciferase family)
LVDFGLGLLGYSRSWEDVVFAEEHGFSTAGFVDSPLLGGDPFVCLGLAAAATSRIRVGTLLAVPGNRSAATTATAIATVNKIAPGRTFLGLGTGYTARNAFGLRPVPIDTFAAFARDCRSLLDGGRAVSLRRGAEVPYGFQHEPGRYIATEPSVPIYLAADGPKALDAVGRHGDGWISTMQLARMMSNGHEVMDASRQTIEASAAEAGRSWEGRYSLMSTAMGVVNDGESLTSPRMLELVGPMAMLPFHTYADNPAIAEFLPPPIQQQLDVYEREVLAKFPGGPEERHFWTHRGHLSYLLPGESQVLTDEIIQMTTLSGTVDEVATALARLEAAGLSNVSLWIRPQLTRETVLDVERRVMPAVRAAASATA